MPRTKTWESGKRKSAWFCWVVCKNHFWKFASESMSSSAYVARCGYLSAHEMLSRPRKMFKIRNPSFSPLERRIFLTENLFNSDKLVNFEWKWETNECYMPLPMPSYGCSNQCNIGTDKYVRQERFSAVVIRKFCYKMTLRLYLGRNAQNPFEVPSFQRT